MPYKDTTSKVARESSRKAQRRYYAKNRVAIIARGKFQSAKYYAALRKLVDEASDVPCMDCGNRYPAYVMDFDHRDPATKRFKISNGVGQRYGVQTMLDEMAKCDVVCANCHRVRTHNQYQAKAGKPWYDRWLEATQ